MKKSIEQEHGRLQSLRKDVETAIGTVEQGVVESLEERRRRLQEELKTWREDRPLESLSTSSDIYVNVAEIRRATVEAEAVARSRGLDVDRLNGLFERTKRVIRESDFVIPGQLDYDKDEKLSTRIMALFVLAHDYEESIAQARRRHQQYKVGLYKNAAFAYIDALLASREPPPGCDCTRPPRQGAGSVDGVDVPSFDCPDPVVQHMRRYLDAVRSIQGADAEALAAEAEMVLAEQQLASDLISGLPLVGEALDFYIVMSGEDLAGTPYPPAIRQFMGLLVLLPMLNSRTAQVMVDQVTARSRSAAVAVESLNDYFRLLEYMTSDSWYHFKWGGKDAARAVYEGAARQFGVPVERFKQVMTSFLALFRQRPALDISDPLFQQRAWRRIREGIQGRADVLEFRRIFPSDIQERVLQRASRNVREGILDVQGTMGHVTRRSGIHRDHLDAFRVVAIEQGEIIIVRPVNPKSARLMGDLGAATKHMGIKSKSATDGPIAALIPVDQALNKLGSELDELMARKRLGGPAGEMGALDTRIAQLQRDLAEGAAQMKKCLSKPDECAQAVTYQVKHPASGGSVDLLVVRDKTTGRQVFGIEGPAGKLLDPDTGKVLDIAPAGNPRQVQVLATPEGIPITADYDILSFGRRDAPYDRLGSSPTMGGITESQVRSVDRINEVIDHRGGKVVHHGAEDSYFMSRAADYPVTIFEPDGRVITIPACDASCMADWCRRNPNRCKDGQAALDPDRLLKDYFYLKKLEDFNLDPNPNWKWGPFNVLAGFAARIYHTAF